MVAANAKKNGWGNLWILETPRLVCVEHICFVGVMFAFCMLVV